MQLAPVTHGRQYEAEAHGVARRESAKNVVRHVHSKKEEAPSPAVTRFVLENVRLGDAGALGALDRLRDALHRLKSLQL